MKGLAAFTIFLSIVAVMSYIPCVRNDITRRVGKMPAEWGQRGPEVYLPRAAELRLLMHVSGRIGDEKVDVVWILKETRQFI